MYAHWSKLYSFHFNILEIPKFQNAFNCLDSTIICPVCKAPLLTPEVPFLSTSMRQVFSWAFSEMDFVFNQSCMTHFYLQKTFLSMSTFYCNPINCVLVAISFLDLTCIFLGSAQPSVFNCHRIDYST